MELHDAADALGALAHETRLAIFKLLVRYAPEGLSVGRIAEQVPIPPATLSFHLAHLQRAGLLESRRESRQIIYTANLALMGQLMGFLTEHCCEGTGLTCDSDACS